MSRPPRFFIAPSQITGDRITVTGEDLRHIRTVLRKRQGDLLTLLDGRGGEYAVTIAEVRKDEIMTMIVEKRERELRGPRLVLGQGLPKADKMDLIVQKATELGVSAIVPLVTERTMVKVREGEKRVVRWQKIAREAAMQSHRLAIPVVREIIDYHEFLEKAQRAEIAFDAPLTRKERQGAEPTSAAPVAGSLLLIPWEEGIQPLKEVLTDYPAVQTIVVLIGPEGGFSLNEAGMAKEKGFRAVSLGPTILRTETAAIAVLSMIGYEYFSSDR